MLEQVTKGIKISVETNFQGVRFEYKRTYFAFEYSITIENQSSDVVQLLSRKWNIHDSLNQIEVVEGDGVIGEKPVINPKQAYTYSSHCFLSSPIGAMNGHYNMINFSTTQNFKVQIPTFQLMVPATLN